MAWTQHEVRRPVRNPSAGRCCPARPRAGGATLGLRLPAEVTVELSASLSPTSHRRGAAASAEDEALLAGSCASSLGESAGRLGLPSPRRSCGQATNRKEERRAVRRGDPSGRWREMSKSGTAVCPRRRHAAYALCCVRSAQDDHLNWRLLLFDSCTCLNRSA